MARNLQNGFEKQSPKPFCFWLSLAITLLAFGLRVGHLGAQSIWYDEGLSWYYASQPLDNLVSLVAGSEHPPFYFLLLHFWLSLTTLEAGRPGSEFLLRFPSLLAGVLLVPLVYTIGSRLLGRRAGTIAALLTALSPFQIWYAQEARGYTLMVLLTWAASYLLLRRHRKNARSWGLYALLLALSLYTHLYAAFTMLAHAVFMAWWAWRSGKWRAWWAWVGSAAVAGMAFLPYGLGISSTLSANDTYWRGVLQLRWAVAQVLHACAVGEVWQGPTATALTALYLALAALGLAWLSTALYRIGQPKRDSGHSRGIAAVFLAASICVPLIALLLIAYGRPKFAPRYLLGIAPALALLVAQAVAYLAGFGRRLAWRGLAGLLLAAVVAGSCYGLSRAMTDPESAKPDWRSVGRYLVSHATPD
ncbi:MAG: glycosyltransferase family 39 protein, partial [Anaerolineae bacterium]|nr:glycosyltransferase family 39 protein [Anaerolineae bacterium]